MSEALLSPAESAAPDSVPERSAVDPGWQWDVAALYPTDGQWEADFSRIDALTAPIEAMRGQLASADSIARMLEAETALDRLLEKLYAYAHLRADEDTAHAGNQGRSARIRAKLADVSGRLAWIQPEILSRPEADLRAWTDSPVLRENRYAMIRLARRKPHTRSDREEELLSRAGEIFAAPAQTFNLLTNADLRFPEVTDSLNRKRELSEGRFRSFLMDRDRRVRRDAFDRLYETYGAFRNTLSCTLATAVKFHNFMARTRRFASALEWALHEDQIPVALYETLIAAVRGALPMFFSYLRLRARQLRLDRVDMFDMYVPIVPDCEVRVPFEQAREWVLAAFRPLGADYVAAVESAFRERWIDVYENRGKRSGAYASGCYDGHPYVLMNYQGTLDDVFTLAHELGHAMHSWLANRAQPHRFARYAIFVAEIASTANEELLLRHLLGTTADPAFRAYLLNHLCDAFKGTVYRQTMFAEFEKRVHEMDARATPLTPDELTRAYYELNREYYGPDVDADPKIGVEWSRIPHFYYQFYVYKYATSFCAAQIFAERIASGVPARDAYLGLLRAGGSDDPLALIARAGVDLLDRATIEGAFHRFDGTVRELGALLG